MKKTITITGMHCNSCAENIKAELKDLGVKANIKFNSGKTILDFNEKEISERDIISKIKSMGYQIK